VSNPVRLLAQNTFPELIDGKALKRLVIREEYKTSYVIGKADHPEIFVDGSTIARGFGLIPIVPISDMRGQVDCKVEAAPESDGASDMLLLTVKNQSHFDWRLGDGSFPIRIGVHIKQTDGKILRWDDGFRVPTEAYIRQGESRTIRLPLNTLPLSAEVRNSGPLVAEFALVQDGNTWFGNVSCTVPLR